MACSCRPNGPTDRRKRPGDSRGWPVQRDLHSMHSDLTLEFDHASTYQQKPVGFWRAFFSGLTLGLVRL